MLGLGLRFQSDANFDQPLFESKYFKCVPSLGSVVPGWVLIIPRRQVLNMSQLSEAERNDLPTFFTSVRQEIEYHFGPTSAFEHGSFVRGSLTGCGVDQAHLHVVPVSFKALKEEIADSNWKRVNPVLPHDLGITEAEYLWMAGSEGAFLSFPTIPISQFFRRAISNLLNRPDNWDYRKSPFYGNIAITQQKLRTRIANLDSCAA
jgi:ATP adenylyltransferase